MGRYLVLVVISIVLLGLIHVSAQADDVTTGWENEGIYGGRINALFIDPNSFDPALNQCSTIYLGTHSGAKLFKSTDAGQTWQRIGPVLQTLNKEELLHARLWDIVTDPDNKSIIYLAAAFLFKTLDGGLTWIKLPTEGFEVTKLAIDPDNSKIIYTVEDPHVGKFRIFRSEDGGNNWTMLSVIETPGFATSIMVHPNNSSVMFLTIGLEIGVWPPWQVKGGIYRSTDGGHSWQLVFSNTSKSFGVNDLVCCEINHAFYAATTDGIYKSVDDGDSWSLLKDFKGGIIVINVDSQGVIYAGTYEGIYRSNINSENEWVPTGFFSTAPSFQDIAKRDTEGWCNIVEIDPKNPQVIYATGWHGLWKSEDGGNTWQSITEGINADAIFNLEKSGDTFYACGGTGFYKRTGNKTWEKLFGAEITTFAIDPTNPQKIVLARPGGDIRLEISKDGGETWQPIGVTWLEGYGTCLHVFSMVVYSNTIYLTVATWGGSDGGVVKITQLEDGNLTWGKVSQGYFPQTPVNCLVMDPENSSILYAGTGYRWSKDWMGWSKDSKGGVWKTEDGGQTWQDISSGLPSLCVNSLVLVPTTPRTLYAAVGNAVYKCRVGEGNWVKLAEWEKLGGLTALAIDPNNTETVYAAAHAHTEGFIIFKSTDGGNSWSEYAKIGYEIYDMVVGSLYVATSGGVWRYLEKETVLPTSSHWWFAAGMIIIVITVAATALTAYIATSRKRKIRALKSTNRI